MIIACILSFAIGNCVGFLICSTLLVASAEGEEQE